ncbi:MAG: hypothetical protein BMS9Abin18_1046 [Zetaproteobacteria bacterium]|nr:MAG: hypothetical protein BMS9Abin18_1046 [Zetaproteobacteria bacterium]
MKYRQRELQTWIMYIMPVVIMLLLFTLPTHANPMHMGMSHHGHHGHMFKPHNAAVHFLGMAKPLQLTGKQISHLVTLRDTWIEKNSMNEARLAAAHADLQRLIMAGPIDLKAVDRTLAQIGPLESGLWHAFARQLHDIKSMLSVEQKQQLAKMHRKMSRHGMGSRPSPGK